MRSCCPSDIAAQDRPWIASKAVGTLYCCRARAQIAGGKKSLFPSPFEKRFSSLGAALDDGHGKKREESFVPEMRGEKCIAKFCEW